MTIGETITKAIKDKGISQRSLCKKVGITFNTLLNLRRLTEPMKYESSKAVKLCEFLGLDPEILTTKTNGRVRSNGSNTIKWTKSDEELLPLNVYWFNRRLIPFFAPSEISDKDSVTFDIKTGRLLASW